MEGERSLAVLRVPAFHVCLTGLKRSSCKADGALQMIALLPRRARLGQKTQFRVIEQPTFGRHQSILRTTLGSLLEQAFTVPYSSTIMLSSTESSIIGYRRYGDPEAVCMQLCDRETTESQCTRLLSMHTWLCLLRPSKFLNWHDIDHLHVTFDYDEVLLLLETHA